MHWWTTETGEAEVPVLLSSMPQVDIDGAAEAPMWPLSRDGHLAVLNFSVFLLDRLEKSQDWLLD